MKVDPSKKQRALLKSMLADLEELLRLQDLPTDAEFNSALSWLPLAQAAQRYGFPSDRAFREWAKRHGILPKKVGQKLFYRPSDIDVAIEQAPTRATTKTNNLLREALAERALSKVGK